MSQRRLLAVDEVRNKQRSGTSGASVVSTGSSTSHLIPFEGLSKDEVTFIDSIIHRVSSSVTTFVPVFKAYQDEFEERGLNATDDQFYYNLLLKLGMIRADNWQEKWRTVKEHFNYASDDLPVAEFPSDSTAVRRASLYHPALEREDDAFTLHSHEEIVDRATPLSYTPTQHKLPLENEALSSEVPRQGSFSQRSSLPHIRPFSSQKHLDRLRLASLTTQDTRDGTSSPTVPVPPHRAALFSANQVSGKLRETRDDAETWRIIQLERDADLFRRESLLSRCLEVWVQGLRWVETTSTRLDNARTEFVLRSVLIKWRDKSAAAVVETKRAAVMDRIRLLSTALSRWRLRAWTLRRKRWADEMRGRMVEMQNSVSKRQLGDFFSRWKRAHSLSIALRQHELFIMQRALVRWHRRLHRVIGLNHRGEEFSRNSEALLLEKALDSWKRRTHLNMIFKIVRARQDDRIQWNALRIWQQKTHVQSVACGFNEARILRNALQRWMQRRSKIKSMERRAVAHQNKPLILAVFRIWTIKTRQQLYTRNNEHRVLKIAIQMWTRRMQKNQEQEHTALLFTKRVVEKGVLSRHLHTWVQQYVFRRRLERRAQRAYEVTLRAKALVQWKTAMWQHAKAAKEAKLAYRIFLERRVWWRWRQLAEGRTREKKLAMLATKRLGQAFHLWRSKAKLHKSLRRKGEVVMMTEQTRVLRDALRQWTLRVVLLKDREYCVLQERRDKLVRQYFWKWRKAIDRQQENTSLMQSFRDVRREETLHRVLNHWIYATRRKRSLVEREEEFTRSRLSQAFEKWHDRYLENNLRPMELDILFQSQTNLLFKMFRLWEARTPSIPAIRFRAHHLRANAIRKWKAAMPAAMKRKEAREHERRLLLGKAISRWKEKYQSKIAAKAIARARYLRLPPAPVKPAASRLLATKPKTGPRSYRSASPEKDPPLQRRTSRALVGPPESTRAPSPASTRASFQGLGGLIKRRPMFTGPSSTGTSSHSSLDGKRDTGYTWEGIGTTRARARAAFSAGFTRPTTSYQESGQDDESDGS